MHRPPPRGVLAQFRYSDRQQELDSDAGSIFFPSSGLQWLAQEWKLPPDDVAKVMRCTTYEIGRFAEK
jgi:hypothetical protein